MVPLAARRSLNPTTIEHRFTEPSTGLDREAVIVACPEGCAGRNRNRPTTPLPQSDGLRGRQGVGEALRGPLC